MNHSLHIRLATIEEAGEAAGIFDEYRMFYGQPSDPAGAETFLRERIRLQDSVLFAAVDGTGRWAGFVQLYPTFSSISMQRSLILNDLYVRPDDRGRGVAQALLDRAKTFAASIGARGLELATGFDNVRAQRLYEKNGFARDTEFYHYFLKVQTEVVENR